MTYLSGKLHKRKQYLRYSFFAIFCGALFFFWPFIRKHTYTSIEPAIIGYSNTKQSFIFFPEFFRTYITSHKTLILRQKELEEEIERLENQLADKDAGLRGVVTTQEGVSGVVVTKQITMYPLMQDLTRLYSTVLLSKGFKDGVTLGMLVYLRGDQVVCTIKEVYKSSSLCALLSASGTTIEGVTSSSSITLTLMGRGGYFLADIARETSVSAGETVYLRSNPRMILGTIKHIVNNNQDTSWHAFIEGGYNPLTSSIFYAQP